MKPAPLSIDQIYFDKVSIEANADYEGEFSEDLMKLDFNFKGSNIFRSVSLGYPAEDAADPRAFVFSLTIAFENEKQTDGIVFPYDVEVRATAYLHYRADESGARRFTAVRGTGYPLLYGAIREMISTLTARSQNGLWLIPAANFIEAAKTEAEEDEADRLERVKSLKQPKPKPKPKLGAKRVSKAKNKSLSVDKMH